MDPDRLPTPAEQDEALGWVRAAFDAEAAEAAAEAAADEAARERRPVPEPDLPCPDCARRGRVGRIGSQRRECRLCNRWAQGVIRRTAAILREETPEIHAAARALAEVEVHRIVTARPLPDRKPLRDGLNPQDLRGGRGRERESAPTDAPAPAPPAPTTPPRAEPPCYPASPPSTAEDGITAKVPSEGAL